MIWNKTKGYVKNGTKVGKIYVHFGFVDLFVSLGRKNWVPLAYCGMSRKPLTERCILILISRKLHLNFNLT